MTKQEKKQMKTALALDGAESAVQDIGKRLANLGDELRQARPPRLEDQVKGFIDEEIGRLERLTQDLIDAKEMVVDLSLEYFAERKIK